MIDRRCLFSALTEVCASAAARTQVRQRVAHVSCPRAISTSAARANAGRPQRTNEESTSTSTNASTPTESSSVHAGNSAQVESADASASSSSPSDPQSSFGTSTGAVAAAQDRKPLPFLSQPLGVHERPTSTKKSWGEKRAEMLDTDRRIAKRKIM